MKHILTLLLFVTVTLNTFAQTPEKMSYQAIIRSSGNTLVTNSNVSLKIIIHQGSSNGTVVYQENHTATSNSNGLVSLEIGTGSVVTGNFSTIAWQLGLFFIETQVDVTGGSNYNVIGTSQLLSVPYALHAKSVDKAQIISLTSSRNVAATDVKSTIECTSSATLTLTSGFSAMAIGETINLEAHNGAVLTIQASSGVTLNYTANGSALFTSASGNVRFGMLRKSGTNAYIISGQ